MDTEFVKKITKVIMQVVFIVAIVYFLSYTFCCKILMQGFSMKDTIQDKNIVLVNRLYKRFLPINRYDIIALKIDGQETVKRVIGLPGDVVKISSGVIFVNDERLDEKYAKTALSANVEQLRPVGDNEYYVIGDNLDSSKDSRFDEVGNISFDYVIGKVWLILG